MEYYTKQQIDTLHKANLKVIKIHREKVSQLFDEIKILKKDYKDLLKKVNQIIGAN